MVLGRTDGFVVLGFRIPVGQTGMGMAKEWE